MSFLRAGLPGRPPVTPAGGLRPASGPTNLPLGPPELGKALKGGHRALTRPTVVWSGFDRDTQGFLESETAGKNYDCGPQGCYPSMLRMRSGKDVPISERDELGKVWDN